MKAEQDTGIQGEGTAEAADVEGDGLPAGSSPQEEPVDAAAELEALTGEDESKSEEEKKVEDEKTEDEDEDEKRTTGHRNEKAEKRIAELTATRKSAEEKATAAEARAKSLEEQAGANLGLHPDMLSAEEAKLIRDADALESRESFLLRHIRDGYENPKDAAKNMTPEEVADELVQVRRRASSVVPKANALFEAKLARQSEALKIGLRMLAEREAALKKGQAAKVPVKTGVAPAIPPGTISARPGVSEKTNPRGMNVGRFEKAGADRTAAARELGELAGGD